MERQTVAPGEGLPPPDGALIQRELDRVLKSEPFHGSKRCRDFLVYVVAKTLDGETENIKERTLAVEVFGRNAGSDLDHDSIVRVGAREVRKRLLQYYSSEGAGSVLRIELPTGSYIPLFHHPLTGVREAVPEPSRVPAQESAPSPADRWYRRRWAIAVFLAIVVAAAFLTVRLRSRRWEQFESFWQPAFQQKGPLLLVLAHPIVYHPSSRATELDRERHAGTQQGLQRPVELPPELLNGSDFVPVFDQYVGFGDCLAAFRLTELFVQRSDAVRVRLASKLEFPDLRDSGAVLIGAFTNRWSMELTKGLRYQFAQSNGKPCIRDSTNGKEWTLTGKTDNGHSTEDYMIISRLPASQTGRFVVVGAGLTQYGTEETGRILASPDVLAPILAKLPSRWKNQNLQLVLHSEILGDSPAQPELIGSHVW